MKKVLLSFALILLICFIANAQSRKIVQFAKGKTSSIVSGTLNGDKYIDYVINAGAGQILFLDLTPKDKAELIIYEVDDENMPDAAGISGGAMRLDNTGNYTVRVGLTERFRKRKAAVSFKLKIEVRNSE